MGIEYSYWINENMIFINNFVRTKQSEKTRNVQNIITRVFLELQMSFRPSVSRRSVFVSTTTSLFYTPFWASPVTLSLASSATISRVGRYFIYDGRVFTKILAYSIVFRMLNFQKEGWC